MGKKSVPGGNFPYDSIQPKPLARNRGAAATEASR